ncbi:MAG: DUF742 domain-containing protein [Actinomycetota bacterium]
MTAHTRLRVRPYVLTGGRSETEVDLSLEAVLAATELGRTSLGALQLEREQLVAIAVDSVALTEMAARLSLPVAVVRVLVGDLVADGMLEVTADAAASTARPDVDMLEKVLDGLQSL